MQPESEQRLHGLNKFFSEVGLVFLFLGYWVFVRQLEQVDLTRSTYTWVQGIVGVLNILPASNFFIWLAGFFPWRVLRHLIPFVVGLWLAREAVLGMMQSFYELEDRDAAAKLLSRLSSSRIGFSRPTAVDLANFEENRKTNPLLKLGGPGRIMVTSGAALVTEKDGRFSRVLESGRHTLRRFEKPRTLIDLRPHEKESENVKLMTNDGIELTTSLTITFQIWRGNEKPTRENPFPFDKEAVRKAAYMETNEPNGNVGYWDKLPMLITAAQLRRVVGEYSMNELIVSTPNGIDVHRRLQLEMERRARPILLNFGIWIRGTRLGALKLDKVVEDHRINYWRTNWNTQQILEQADGDAEVLHSREVARAEAEAIMLRAIAEGLQRSQGMSKEVSSRQIVALRLIESLEEMARNSEEMVPVPDQLMHQLGSIHQRVMMLTSGEAEEPATEE